MKQHRVLTYLFLLSSILAFSQQTPSDTAALLNKKEQLNTMKTQADVLKKNIEQLQQEIKDISTPLRYFDQALFTYANFSQSQFVNWLAGGENSVSFILGADYVLTYRDRGKNISWDTKASGMLGYQNDKELGIVKSNDLLTVNSNFAYALIPKWSVAADFYLRSQFLVTEKYTNGKSTVASSFFSPANINLGVGAKWNPLPWVSTYLSPLTSQMTVVANKDVDPVKYGMDTGQRFRMEAGWYVNVDATKTFFSDALIVNARCILFQNYIVSKPNNFIDVDFRLKLDAKLSKYFYAILFLNLRYDADEKQTKSILENGVTRTVYNGVGLQFYENLGIGFSYNLGNKY